MTSIPNTPPLREEQIQALVATRKAFEEGYQNVIIQAPTGTGKTLLSRYIAEAFSDALIGVPTRNLQDQYSHELAKTGNVAILKGKANYVCAIEPGLTVDEGPCQSDSGLEQLKECQESGCCPYLIAKEDAQCARFAVLSFAGMLAFSTYAPLVFGKRELHLIDEAHKMEGIIREHFSTAISEVQLRRNLGRDAGSLRAMPQSGGRTELLDYLRSCLQIAQDSLNGIVRAYSETSVESLYERSLMQPSLRRRLEPILKFRTVIEEMFTQINEKEDSYLLSIDQKEYDGKKVPHIVIKPIHLQGLVRDHVLSERNVFMSATLVGVEQWARSLGIENYTFIDVPSSFPPQNRKIFFTPIGSLSAKNMKELAEKGIDKLEKIANHEKFKNEKGLVHVPSYSFAAQVGGILQNQTRYLVADKRETAQLMLRKHLESTTPTILIGPSFTEGIDLKHDLCRFIVIWKCQYGNPNDPLLQYKLKHDRTWDIRRLLSDFVQQTGRGVRSKDDWAVTYVLDENLRKEVRRHKNMLPKYFLEAIQNLEG